MWDPSSGKQKAKMGHDGLLQLADLLRVCGKWDARSHYNLLSYFFCLINQLRIKSNKFVRIRIVI
jgi:hypothetical protein